MTLKTSFQIFQVPTKQYANRLCLGFLTKSTAKEAKLIKPSRISQLSHRAFTQVNPLTLTICTLFWRKELMFYLPDGAAAQLRDVGGFDRFGFYGGQILGGRELNVVIVKYLYRNRLRFNHDLGIWLQSPPIVRRHLAGKTWKVNNKWNAYYCKYYLNVEKLNPIRKFINAYFNFEVSIMRHQSNTKRNQKVN